MDKDVAQANRIDKKPDNKKEAPKKNPSDLEAKPFWKYAKLVWKKIWQLIGLLGFVLGIVSGYVALIPHLSVSQYQPLDPSAPFSTPFTISNDGPLPLQAVRFTCGIGRVIRADGRTIQGAKDYESSFIDFKTGLGLQYVSEMQPGEKATVGCAFPIEPSAQISLADVAIAVSFRPYLVPVDIKRKFRFQTEKAGDGHLYWFPQPEAGANYFK